MGERAARTRARQLETTDKPLHAALPMRRRAARSSVERGLDVGGAG